VTPQQYNVLRILRGAGEEGIPTLEIAERNKSLDSGGYLLGDEVEIDIQLEALREPQPAR
jgi:hypothetical protein